MGAAETPTGPGNKRTVLFVDDEPRVLTSMRAMFRRDYDVLLANSGAEAIELLGSRHVDVIVSDQRMPGMTGVEMLKQVKTLAPQAMRILLTGYADLQAIEESINEGEVFRYLTKPCPSDQLKAAIGLAAGREPAERVPEQLQPPEHAPEPTSEHTHTSSERPQRQASAAPTVARISRPSARPVDVLLLSNDAAMVSVLQAALGDRHRLRVAGDLDAAVAILERHPVGVLVTDTAVDEQGIALLTTTLKRHVPDLVTIVASSRSDAQLLIELINYGQIFRFLLKPLHSGQCRLSIESAVQKHRALATDPRQRLRHAVAEPVAAPTSPMTGMFDRIRRLRDRIFAFNDMA
jgi:DNA-binding NtrC family response regulator